MVSTITPTTTSILSSPALTGSLMAVGVLVLISLLVLKELASASTDHRLHQFSRLLNIAILPLLFGFILIVIFKVIDALS